MSHSCLPNLVKIHIDGWRRCENRPSLGNLPLLKSLGISGMDSLKCIGSKFYGDHGQGIFFPALKELEIVKMTNLEDWSSPSNGGELEGFPSLEIFTLSGCLKLRTLPRLPSSLKELFLSEFNEMILERLLENVSPNSSSLSTLSISGFDNEFIRERRWAMMLWKLTCLQNLNIRSCHKIKILPKELLESLTTVTEFSITYCKEMVCLPVEMQSLTSLKFFGICECHSLKCLPELGSRNNTVMTRLSIRHCYCLTSVSDCLRHLTTLEELEIVRCPELEFLQDDFQDLTSLRSLSLSYLPKMTCLPEGLQLVAGTLESLSITWGCSGLTSLPEWIGKFTSLQKLLISDCKNLKVLPEQVLQLTALKTLSIRDCHPDLHRTYAKETGEEWHKIEHIPDLYITPTIETNTRRTIETNTRKMRMKCNNVPCFSSSSGTN